MVIKGLDVPRIGIEMPEKPDFKISKNSDYYNNSSTGLQFTDRSAYNQNHLDSKDTFKNSDIIQIDHFSNPPSFSHRLVHYRNKSKDYYNNDKNIDIEHESTCGPQCHHLERGERIREELKLKREEEILRKIERRTEVLNASNSLLNKQPGDHSNCLS